MRAHEELVMRLALKRRNKLGGLSDEGFAELLSAVSKNYESFIDDNEEEAFHKVERGLKRLNLDEILDGSLDTAHYEVARVRKMATLENDMRQAVALDPLCADARNLLIMSELRAPDLLLKAFLDLEKELEEKTGPIQKGETGDAWDDVFQHPRLRLANSIARYMLESGRYRLTVKRCYDLMELNPSDALGARYTCALALARLEDEEGFNALDALDMRKGNAWIHLGRAILMYKLGRVPAARRALNGFNSLCPGGTYALLQPHYLELYFPDRPEFEAGSFWESFYAIHEAGAILDDIPDFARWAAKQKGIEESARTFCKRNGFDWIDWE